MTRYKFLAIHTKYWKPNTNYLEKIVRALQGKIQSGDIVTLSEKALSTATGNIVDEHLNPSITAKLLAKYWMRHIWAHVLGPLCHLRKETIAHFRNYPIKKGSIHKQLALQYFGFLQALRQSSEGGIDGSNLPYSFVSLPLRDAFRIATEIKELIQLELDENVIVMIVDSDGTYSWRNLHFTPVYQPIKGIWSIGGVVSYLIGRVLRLKRRATPRAIAGGRLGVEEALTVAEIANHARGFGAGRTIWDMATRFQVSLDQVSWEMLANIKHTPIVIVRSIH